MTTQEKEISISANIISQEDRMDFLPSFFGFNLMLVGESMVYSWMERLSKDYKGGYWNFYRLSNGGFYMAPNYTEEMSIEVVGNYVETVVSPDAAGIIATAFALGQMSTMYSDERLIDLYHLLRSYIHEHSESSAIFQAID